MSLLADVFQHLDIGHYLSTVSHSFLCRYVYSQYPDFCARKGAFHEWTDRQLLSKWSQILATSVGTLTVNERRTMRDEASSHGILAIYRQTLLFTSVPRVNEFRVELEHRYGYDVIARKGDEIIFTTEQLIDTTLGCGSFSRRYQRTW